MDRRERIKSKSTNAQLVAIRAALAANEAGIWTALPATVASFNAGAVTVEAQPTIQAQIRQPDGTWVDTNLPLCVDCPIAYPGGGGFVLTWPLVKDDEGVLVFASRCIDSWWQSGGIQKQAELRMHDLSDGFFFPTGGMSQPNIPSGINAAGPELRSKDGNSLIRLETSKITMSLNSGRTELIADDTLQEVQIVAINGLWVNGVRVTVP